MSETKYKWWKIIRWTGLGILGLFLLAWLLVGGYILLNKQALLRKAGTALSKRTGGLVSVGDMDISFLRQFPNVTLHLSKVSVKDSLWPQHHHDLLQADNIDLRLSFFSLFSGHPNVSKVGLRHGVVYLFTDSTGYSNTDILKNIKGKQDKGQDDAADKETQLPEISLSDLRVVFEKLDKHKLFDFDIHQLDCSIDKDSRSLSLDVNTDMQVNSFSLNTEKGSFMQHQALSGHFALQYNTASKIIQFNKVGLTIGGYPFLVSGRFFPDVSPDPFYLTIQVSGIPYSRAAALLTPKLHQKLDEYNIDKPVSINAIIDAGSADDREPLLNIRMILDKGTVTTPIGQFTEASFTGVFSNEWVRGRKREDENSIIRFYSFAAKWENLPLRSDTIRITNLHRPLLACDVHSDFGLEKLNELAGSNSIQFGKGTGALNVFFQGPLSKEDSTGSLINGTLGVDTATVTYLPYGFKMTDCSGKLRFKEQDFFIDKLEARAGSSKVVIKGSVKNLVSLMDKSPEKVQLDCSISSPRLDLRDLVALAGHPVIPQSAAKPSKSPFGKTSAQVDRLLRECTVHLLLDAADLNYQKFSGAHAKAEVFFKDNEIRLANMLVQQESGTISFSGKIQRQEGKRDNPLTLRSHIDQADISRVFASFNNFGQQGLVAKNLRGKLTADIALSGLITDKAVVVPSSLKGAITFNLKDGQLVDYPPMEKINESVLKKRDLSTIQFAELKNQLDVNGTNVYIHRMEIQSTALTLFIEGQYDWKTGPDLSIQVPLSNLKKRDQDAPPENKGTGSKTGISIWLRAKTGNDGKLDIHWDPFKKALKNLKKKS